MPVVLTLENVLLSGGPRIGWTRQGWKGEPSDDVIILNQP